MIDDDEIYEVKLSTQNIDLLFLITFAKAYPFTAVPFKIIHYYSVS